MNARLPSSDSVLRGTKSYRVTVLVMTYNHERYIRQALDSVLMQETSFDYEVLISEDCSTDGTREIVEDYGSRHPQIRLILSDRNLHCNEVVARGLRSAQGEYVALLDGDDYWISSAKLQAQVEFLDARQGCSMCFHQAMVRDEISGKPDFLWSPDQQSETASIRDIWRGNFIATCSAMFRRNVVENPPEWYSSFPVTDWPLHILAAERGDIGYIRDVMGVYRYHAGGAYSTLTEVRKQDETWRMYQLFWRLMDGKHRRFINEGICEYFLDWTDEYIRRGDRHLARRCLRRGLTGSLSTFPWGYRRLARTLLLLTLGSRRPG